MVDIDEVARHNSKENCWIIIHGQVYDVTEFLPNHPGGQSIILRYAGKDATKKFDTIHPKDIVDKFLPKSKHLGPVSGTVEEQTPDEVEDPEEAQRLENVKNMPKLSQMYNLLDFEHVARRIMPKAAWSYYSSGSDDEISLRENHSAFHRIWFRPAVMVDVSEVDFSTNMLGTKTSVPFYITATALGKLGHEEGEVVLTKAAGKEDVIQMIPTLASCPFDEIVDASIDRQTQWMQLYVNSDREITRELIQHAEKRGIKGLWITVDAPQLGRREKDMRSKYDQEISYVQDEEEVDRSQGAARAISSFIDPSLSWKDLPWFRSITKMPIVLKGVQRAEDVLKAVEYGIEGVVLSNHGGRQLEFARSSIEVLVEVMDALRQRGWQDRIEVYIDGGIRRGTDILKAIALGAKGVGIGRPFLYAMSTYGVDGVQRAIRLLKDELEMNMRLLGATNLSQLNPSFLDVRSLAAHSGGVPDDNLSLAVYEKLQNTKFKGSKL
jgi:L-lactate dehydrogenase (cytochrome)